MDNNTLSRLIYGYFNPQEIRMQTDRIMINCAYTGTSVFSPRKVRLPPINRIIIIYPHNGTSLYVTSQDLQHTRCKLW